MALSTFLIFSVLISLGSAQVDIEINTQNLSHALQKLEIKLVKWVGDALGTLFLNIVYTAEVLAALVINTILELPYILWKLGNGLLEIPAVTDLITQACTKGDLNCNDGISVVTLNITVTGGTGDSALCIAVEDTDSIPGVAVIAFDDALCVGSDLSTVIGADSLQADTIVGSFGGKGFLFCQLEADCALYIYDTHQNVLNFNQTVSSSK